MSLACRCCHFKISDLSVHTFWDGNFKKFLTEFFFRSHCLRPGKNVLVLVIGQVDFDTNKKKAGRKINTTPRKIQSPVFFSPVNHRHPGSSAFCC